MQVGMDFQTNYLVQIKGCIQNFNHSLIPPSEVAIKAPGAFSIKNYNEPAMYTYLPDSMFSGATHAAVNDLLKAIASPIITLRLKRINVWYQNLDNANDFMVKTLPGDKDFLPRGPKDVT